MKNDTNGNDKTLAVLSPEGLPLSPTPYNPRLRLNTVKECRRELAKLYIAARKGAVPTATATRLAYILVSLSNMIRDSEIEDRVAVLEANSDKS